MLSLSGKTPNYKGKRIGLIFDGESVVGTFEFFTCEDCVGERKLSDVSIYASEWDIVNGRSNRPLEFRYVEVIDYDSNRVKLIDSFGHGILRKPQSLFADYRYCNMKEVVWCKCPESFRYAN